MNCEGCNDIIKKKLQCPVCLKIGIISYFCSQLCFKENWEMHKNKHHRPEKNPWPEFEYTGELRPYYPISPRRKVPEHIQIPEYAKRDDGICMEEESLRGNMSIKILSPLEIDGMRVVCKMAREVLDIGASHLRIGITTEEIDKIIHDAIIERDGYPSPLNYYGFPKSICTSVNEVICHGIPDKRPLQDGDIVNLDVTVYYNGFHGDLNETYCIGNVDFPGKRLIKCAKECLEKAIKICRPGVRYRDIGDIIQKEADEWGYSITKTYGGHGIHRLFHCAPLVPHYGNNKAIGIMKPGHVFTIEPMINEGSWRDVLWPDNWTVVTKDGKRSAQFEHTLLITETGVEILTKRNI